MICGWPGRLYFFNVVDRHGSLSKKRVRSSNYPWMTRQLKRYVHERDELTRKSIIATDPWDWAIFKKLRSQVNSKTKNAKEMLKNAFQQSRGNSRKT